jgi:ubiquinone biosynthesis monooxygenase Coq7
MGYDITIIRPEMREEQVKPRGRGLSKEQRKAARKALQTLHSLEIMAVNIYKCQITE